MGNSDRRSFIVSRDKLMPRSHNTNSLIHIGREIYRKVFWNTSRGSLLLPIALMHKQRNNRKVLLWIQGGEGIIPQITLVRTGKDILLGSVRYRWSAFTWHHQQGITYDIKILWLIALARQAFCVAAIVPLIPHTWQSQNEPSGSKEKVLDKLGK